jgi:hypothetical protein
MATWALWAPMLATSLFSGQDASAGGALVGRPPPGCASAESSAAPHMVQLRIRTRVTGPSWLGRGRSGRTPRLFVPAHGAVQVPSAYACVKPMVAGHTFVSSSRSACSSSAFASSSVSAGEAFCSSVLPALADPADIAATCATALAALLASS